MIEKINRNMKKATILLVVLVSFINVQAGLPENFPKITIDSIRNPFKGYTFMNSISFGGKTVNYNFILDSAANVFFFQKPYLIGAIDFKMQPNGLFSYGSPVKLGSKYQAGPILVQNVMVEEMILDSSFKIIDRIQMKNGYLADVHDFIMLPNGNYLLMAYETNPIDMSRLLPEGDPNQFVVGTVIQELDKDKNCIFQWRSTDFIPILETFDDVSKKTFEHVHGNSMFIDTDGNLIASFATTNEIVKIDMVSGDIIWRLGGRKNQFKFNNEHNEQAPLFFSMAHDAKRLDNGNLLFYDNGVMKKNWYSRAVEYLLDESKKEVSLLWEYRHNPDISAFAMGSAQRLGNGNTLINWGLIFKGFIRTLTEVNKNNEIELEISLPSDAYSYRANKYDLPACEPIADVDKYEILKGNTYSFKNQFTNTGVQIYFESFEGFIYNLLNVKKYNCAPMNPVFYGEAPVILPLRYTTTQYEIKSFKGEFRIELSSLPKLLVPNQMNIYFRPQEGNGTFIKLKSNIDANNKYLVAQADTFGEFIVGLERISSAIKPPTIIFPYHKQTLVNDSAVFLNWSATGRYDDFNIQISTNDNFENLILDSNNIDDTRLFYNFDNNSKYFWRVRTLYNEKYSDWSEVREFNLSEPYVKLISPNGKEVFTKDSSYVLRWETNIIDSVKVTLLKDGEEYSKLSDSLFSFFDGFLWLVPTNIPDGNDYAIQVESIKNKSMAAISKDNFTIKSFVNVNENPFEWKLSSYPNPANGKVKIEFSIEKPGVTSIVICDLFGNIVKELFQEYCSPGKYTCDYENIQLNSGVYYYKLVCLDKIIVKKMIIKR